MNRVQMLYFAPGDLLVPRVDRQCIMRFCEAMAATGVAVEAVSFDIRLDFDEPTRSRDLFDVYGITTPFEVKILPSWHRQTTDKLNPLWRAVGYTWWLILRLLAHLRAFTYDRTIVYFKNYLIGVPFLFIRWVLGRRVVLLFEIHVPPPRRAWRFLLRRMDGVIPVSHILARELVSEWGIEEDQILVAHMGVNLKRIDEQRVGKEEARRKLGLPLDRALVVYTGKVHANSDEIALLLQAARLVSDEADLVIVGGREDQVTRLRQDVLDNGITNVRFVGFVAPGEVHAWQMAADALVTYYPSNLPINKYRASPGKLFEYMASGRPIITADYPALREALSPDAALFVPKDEPPALAEGIRRVLGDPELGERLARRAAADVQQFTWERRAARVLSFADRPRTGRGA
jgi:glycosyltransferase involved in cell wall biosynthesis